MSGSERFQLLESVPERMVDLRKLQQCLRFNKQGISSLVQPLVGQCVEGPMHFCDSPELDGESTSCRMSTMAFQQSTAVLKCPVNGEAFGCAHGCPHPTVTLA